MESTLAAPPSVTVKANKTSYRFETIDLLRGLVMIIMALDHTRDFFHSKAMTEDPLGMQTTTPILFFTRWITHFCAPVFVFLAGSSAWFQGLRKSKHDLSLFLIKRGLWLIFMEIVVVNLFYSFDFGYGFVGLQTIWAIGASMVILGLFIWLPLPLIAAAGFLIVFGHNALDFYEKGRQAENLGVMYDLLHRVQVHPLDKTHALFIFYPFLPWTGLMLLGYCFGKIFTTYQGKQRRNILLWTGFAVIATFIILRWIDVYGDPKKWSDQKNLLYTILNFLDNQKYPPSLLYMCMTIGPAIIFLALVRKTDTPLARFISVYGRVPFFYYLAHFLLIHLLSMAFFFARGHSLKEGMPPPPNFLPNFIIPGEGVSLGFVYLIWAAIVLSLYPLCKWYDRYKSSHREKWWLSYF